MVFQNWILPFLIGIVAAYLLMSILYINYPEVRQKFSDLGALIQLQTSRPAYYANWVPENQSVYNNVVNSGILSLEDKANHKITIEVSDIKQNTTVLNFNVVGDTKTKNTEPVLNNGIAAVFHATEENQFRTNDFFIKLPPKNSIVSCIPRTAVPGTVFLFTN